MSEQRGFRYALEPVLSQRQWRVDALELELARRNAELDARQSEANQTVQRAAAAVEEWRQLAVPGQRFDPQRAAVHARHAARLERDVVAARAAVDELRAARDETALRLMDAVRALDALREHRRGQHKGFQAEQAHADGIAADDHWLTLSNRRDDVHQA